MRIWYVWYGPIHPPPRLVLAALMSLGAKRRASAGGCRQAIMRAWLAGAGRVARGVWHQLTVNAGVGAGIDQVNKDGMAKIEVADEQLSPRRHRRRLDHRRDWVDGRGQLTGLHGEVPAHIGAVEMD